jgi:hypothetical protein
MGDPEKKADEKLPLFDTSAPETFCMVKVAVPMPGRLPARVIPGLEVKYFSASAWQALVNLQMTASQLVLEHLVTGWEGMPEVFSQAALAKFLDDFPAAPNAIINAYIGELFGYREKN